MQIGAASQPGDCYHAPMAKYRLAPGIGDFIERYLEISGLSTADSVPQQRIDYEAVVACFRHPRPDGIDTRDSLVTGRHGDIPLRHYRYRSGNAGARILFIHGGGFILGNLDTHDDICAEICAATGFDLVSVDYRLAPEFLHPVQLDDVEDAFLDHWHERTILLGASAGATLAAALCHRLRGRRRRPAGQVLIYPALGGECFELESYRTNSRAPLLSTADILFYRGVRYRGDDLPVDDPEFYPLAAQAFDGIPATIAFSADVDPLRDDAQLYVEKLAASGVPAEWINEAGLVHDYLRARHISDCAGAAFARICEAVTRLARGVAPS